MKDEMEQVRAALRAVGIDLARATEYEPDAIALEAFRAGREASGVEIRPLEDVKRELVLAAYRKYGSQRAAADALGVSRASVGEWLRMYGEPEVCEPAPAIAAERPATCLAPFIDQADPTPQLCRLATGHAGPHEVR